MELLFTYCAYFNLNIYQLSPYYDQENDSLIISPLFDNAEFITPYFESLKLCHNVEYKMHGQNFPYLVLKNFKDDYWDLGDCSRLIEKVEESYSIDKAKMYDEIISYMGDILFIYDRIPFIKGIKEVGNSYESYISKEEIDNYIKTFNIKMNKNSKFKLFDERTWEV